MALKTRAISKYNVAVNEQSGKVGNVRYFRKAIPRNTIVPGHTLSCKKIKENTYNIRNIVVSLCQS